MVLCISFYVYKSIVIEKPTTYRSIIKRLQKCCFKVICMFSIQIKKISKYKKYYEGIFDNDCSKVIEKQSWYKHVNIYFIILNSNWQFPYIRKFIIAK